MSGITAPAVYPAIAAALAGPLAPTDEEKLFQEAFEAAKQSKKFNGKLPLAFDHFINARTGEDITQAIQQGRAQNSVWKERHEKSLLKRLERVSSQLLQFKGLIDPLVAINSTVAGPLWGTIAFFFAFFKELASTDELFTQTMERIKTSMQRFKDYYYRPSEVVQKSLRSALGSYYQRIIEYAVELQQHLPNRPIRSILGALQGSVKEIVAKFDKELKYLVEDVDWAANARSHERAEETADQRHQDLLRAIQNRSTHQPTAGGLSISSTAGLPKMLSNNFTGRQTDINAITASLTRSPGDQTWTVVFGMGGVGKTQILLKYADVHHPQHKVNTSYSHVCFVKAHSPEAIQESIEEIIRIFDIERTTSRNANNDNTENFKTWLSKRENWLLLVDDVTSVNHIQSFLPACDRGHILFSTRGRVLAETLAQGSDPIEILPMDFESSTRLAYSWAKHSSFDQDRDVSTAKEVARFAKGLPLAIEQVVKSARIAKPPRSIGATLQQVREKQRLLEQKDPVTFSEHKSSVGAIVMQTMADLKIQENVTPAEVLFRILVYCEVSAIPVRMLLRGIKQLPDFVNRSAMFDRGRVEYRNGTTVDVLDNAPSLTEQSLASQESTQRSKHVNLAKRIFSRPQARKTPSVDLTTPDTSLRRIFNEGTSLSRLFSHEAHLLDAIRLLEQSALVRKIGPEVLWVHDLFAEVAQAIIENEPNENDLSGFGGAVMASTLVYLAFPVPIMRNSSMNRFETCPQYLPHAIRCHHHLRTMQILNDFSVGPELSHIVASTIAKQPWVCADRSSLLEHQIADADRQRTSAILYYRNAMLGYMACHRRLQQQGNSSIEEMMLSIREERNSTALRTMVARDFIEDAQRIGSIPLWRALQSMLRLANLLQYQPDQTSIEEASTLMNRSLGVFEIIFGKDHVDTDYVRGMLLEALFRSERFEEARNLSLKGIEAVLGWDEQTQTCEDNKVYENNILYSLDAIGYLSWALRSCLRLPGQARGKEAVIYAKIMLKYGQLVSGEEHYSLVITLRRLAMAYEQSGEKLASIYWWARSVFCALSILAWEGFDEGERGTPWSGALSGSENILREAVDEYEAARERLGILDEEDTSLTLRQFLVGVDLRIKLWRTDRERNGSPYARISPPTTEEELEQIPCPWLDMIKARWKCEEEQENQRKQLELELNLEETHGTAVSHETDHEVDSEERQDLLLEGAGVEVQQKVTSEEMDQEAGSEELGGLLSEEPGVPSTPSATSSHEDTETIDEAIFPALPPLALPALQMMGANSLLSRPRCASWKLLGEVDQQ